MNNEVIYSILFSIIMSYTMYKWQFYVKKTTDKDDFMLMEAFVTAKRKGLIK
jgi:hypothetical protein